MAAPALTPDQIINMYKAGALNGVNGSIAAKNLVHTIRAGGLRNLPGSYKTMLKPGVRVSPVAPTRGTNPQTVLQDNGVTPSVNNATNFGLDGFGHALDAASPIAPDGTVEPAVIDAAAQMPGFAPGDAPNMGLRVDTAQVDPDPKKKPDQDHDEKFDAFVQKLMGLSPSERTLAIANSGRTPEEIKALQAAIDYWGDHPHRRHEKHHDLFAAKKSPTAPKEGAAIDPKKKKVQQGTVVAQAAPNALPRPKGPDHIG